MSFTRKTSSLTLYCCTFVLLSAHMNVALLPPCDSQIYCYGPVLDELQKAKLFDDNKYLVDMNLREPPDVILSAFHNLSTAYPNMTIPRGKLYDFLHMYYEEPKTESCNPPDWHSSPKFLEGIADKELREWAEEIHIVWKSLCRKTSTDVKDHPELYSQMYTPHPVIVSGQRFREIYYWDTYWVINGLLLSEMTDTANGMLQNFLYYVDRYGFVPNGGRIYYERRSQPPFLTLIVESLYQATKDKEFLRAALPALETEYQFWMRNRSMALTVNGTEHVLNRYFVQVGSPRPESYTHDLELAEGLTDDRKEQLWVNLKTAAESGWDFSSRWYIADDGQNNSTLRDTRTSHILPADLNALLCRVEKTLALYHRMLGDGESAARYEQAAAVRLRAIEEVLWDAERGVWFDYNLVTQTRQTEFYPSNLAPLWARCYSQPEMAEKAVQYLKGSGALQFPGGVPTSLRNSGQQWDYPNAWPPLQHMLIEGLSGLPSEEAQTLAFDLAQRWIETTWLAYKKYGVMFEKYDASRAGEPGGGGEYEVQVGFGWTNGVALQLLNQYGATLASGITHLIRL